MLDEIAQPLIDGIRLYTGLTICLIAGAPPLGAGSQYELYA